MNRPIVVTYSLPYEPGHEIDLCAHCSEIGQDHTLGQTVHGAHDGDCEGRSCPSSGVAAAEMQP